jgi:uncharacterized protein (DUF2164 family)
MTISYKKVNNYEVPDFVLSEPIIEVEKNTVYKSLTPLESDYLHSLEFNKYVRRYIVKPFIFDYLDGNMVKPFIPNIYFENWDNEKHLQYVVDSENDEKLTPMVPELFKEFCIANRITFSIVTEKDIRTPFLSNSKFLLDFINPKMGFNFYDTIFIISILEKNNRITVSELLSIISDDIEKKAEMLYVVWYMISNNLIYCDLYKRLSMDTIVWLP